MQSFSQLGTDAIIRYNVIAGNSATKGGGIYLNGGMGFTDGFQGDAWISTNLITNNSATVDGGGGIWADMFFPGDDLTINDNIITNNSAASLGWDGGGGIYVGSNMGTATINNNTISGNTADSDYSHGGGIFVDEAIPTNISGNIITDNKVNSANGGGGVYLANEFGLGHDADVAITANNIFSNTHSYQAGDIIVVGAPNDLTNKRASSTSAVNAENNYWGTTDAGTSEEHIYHFIDDSSVGVVDYDPFAGSPFDAPIPNLFIDDVSVNEGDAGLASATFTVFVSEPVDRLVAVDYTTQDLTATAGSDYVATSGSLAIFPNTISQTLAVEVIGDRLDELAEDAFNVKLSNPVNATLADDTGMGRIVDEETDTWSQVTLSALQDNTLYEDAGGALSNGAGQHFFAGSNAGGSIRRGVIAFDFDPDGNGFPNIPAGSTIQSASLRLYMSRTSPYAGPQEIALHRLLADWGEGTSDAGGEEGGGTSATAGDATWLHRFYDTDAWGAAGGDFDPTVSASTSVDGVGAYTWESTQLVADVQVWLDNPWFRYGWLVQGNEAEVQTTKRFDTRENEIPENRPQFVVVYDPPDVPSPDLNGDGVVDVEDVGGIAGSWAATDSASLVQFDFNDDDVVNIIDIMSVVSQMD
ncbi:MAG: hypothetical protein MAG451_01840 [Anaerolineales bacterium]|nr:hypothetical protein [Anaerolineales bacterium]